MKDRAYLIRKWDILLITVILLASVAGLLITRNGDGKVAVVEYEGKEVYRVDLSQVKEDLTLSFGTDIKVTLLISNGKIGFASSECKDKICIDFGMLNRKGQCAVCLPAKVTVRIEGGRVDGVTG